MARAIWNGVLPAAVGLLLLSACADSGDDTATSGPCRVLSGVDTCQHEVPLEDIVFDTFGGGGGIPLSEASEHDVERLRDAIPPLDDPPYEPVSGGEWLDDDDVVLGHVDAEGVARAFPHKIMALHEIVNDTFAGVPVLVSYCPLCNSGVVYDRRVEGQTLTFGNSSALYQNDLVMEDRQTHSYWFQVEGKAIVGTLTGASLEPLPSTTARWSEWKALHPDTQVLSRDLGFDRVYDVDRFAGYAEQVDGGQTPFPVDAQFLEDSRLSAATQVIGIRVGQEARAYPLEALAGSAVSDTVGGEPIALFVGEAGTAVGVFDPAVDGTTLQFEFDDGAFIDEQTGSRWDLAGRAVDGELEGERLEAVPSRSTFWFAFVASFPDATVFGLDAPEPS